MKRKRAKTVKVVGNGNFIVTNTLLVVVFLIFFGISIIDKMCCLIEWPNDYENVIGVAAQIIIGMVSLVTSIIGIAISLQNEEYYGIKITKLYALRVSKHYSIVAIIIISIAICLINLIMYMLGLTLASIGTIVVAIVFLIRITIDEVPLMAKKEAAIKQVLRDKLINCYKNKEEAPQELKETFKYLLYTENLKKVYTYFSDKEDEEFNEFLIMKLLEFQHDIASEIKDRHDEKDQKIICSSLMGNIRDILFKQIPLLDSSYNEILKNKHLLTRVLFRIHELEHCRELLLGKISSLFQYLSFKILERKDGELLATILICLVAGTVKEGDFSIIRALRRHLSAAEWELEEESQGLDAFAVISAYLYYLCNFEIDAPQGLKTQIIDFLNEGGDIEENTRILSWKRIFECICDAFNVNYKSFISLAMNNKNVLDNRLYGIGTRTIIFDEGYLTKWYLTNLLHSNKIHIEEIERLLKEDEDVRYRVKQYVEKCFDEDGRFSPTAEMNKAITFYVDDEEPFGWFRMLEREDKKLFNLINDIKAEEIKQEVNLARRINDAEFADKIKQEIEETISHEWGFASDLEITNTSRYFSVLLEKNPKVMNFEESIIDYCIKSTLRDIEDAVKRRQIYRDENFNSNIKDVLSYRLKYITNQAKYAIPFYLVKDEELKQEYDRTCEQLIEVKSKILGNSVIIAENGFCFNCIVDDVEIRKLNEEELSKQVKKYQREDGQHVFDGTFLPKEEILEIVKGKFIILTITIRHQVESSEESIFELKPYSRAKKEKS